MSRAEFEVRGRGGVPVVPAGRLHRWWVNDHVHVVLWFFLAASLLTAYLTLHYRLRPDYLRSPAVSEAVAAAVRAYQVAESPETGRLELTFEGRPIDVTATRPGIAALPPVRGLVAEGAALLAVYDQRLGDYLRVLFESFEPVAGQTGEHEASLARFAGRGFEADEGQVVRVYTGSLRPGLDLALSQASARRLLGWLGRAEVYDLRVPAQAEVEALSPLAGVPVPADALPGVREGLQRIEADLARPPVRLGVQRLAEPSATEVAAAVCDELAELRAPVDAFFGDAVADVPGCSRLLPRGVQGDPFYARLTQRVMAEVGFFWTVGPWRWLEVVLLTWLGVLAECLTRLGVRYAGLDPQRRRWEPRETGRTLLKLAYAPALSMVALWTLLATGALAADGAVWAGGVASFVPIAFALGLFPDLGLMLLERLARALFGETSVARPGAGPERLFRTERGTPPVAEGAAPDFAVVRRQIIRHGSAPLRRDG